MNFSEAVKSYFKKYAQFKERSSRSEYWYSLLFLLLVGIGTGIIDGILFGLNNCAPRDFSCNFHASLVSNIFTLATFLPSVAVYVRRLHDVGRSGWWMFTLFPPLYWIFIKGTTGKNKFGDDPLAAENYKDKAIT